ncbi:GNAT family N-acetyltransferase [Loigolactobacillus zhaoyuanensis]|uniref:GNAT family N-acetyltransferase n=1 Tax=Loigolactobacillus zhaoyuanensis TaxID=2486017 RepID=UPI000F73A508|nr:GNAT family N-acetyltransferase [Loigolactobacillus zhaoyuanensis]
MSNEVTIRIVRPTDAAQLLTLLRQLQQETPFLLADATDLASSATAETEQLTQLLQTDNNLLLVAALGDQLVGFARVAASSAPEIQHIGEVGIALLHEFWGYGLGTALLEEVLAWAQANPLMRRLELTVQQRNQRAYQLYQKLGFQVEGQMARGFYDEQAGFQTLIQMALLIDHD